MALKIAPVVVEDGIAVVGVVGVVGSSVDGAVIIIEEGEVSGCVLDVDIDVER